MATKTKMMKRDEEWQQQLTPEQYHITRKKGTERAFTGQYYNTKDKGQYQCVCCGTPLFSSETKYDSGSGLHARFMVADECRSNGDCHIEVA